MFRSMNSFKKAWLKALRSGEYVQGHNALCIKGGDHDHFCCLGVAFDVLVLNGHDVEWKDYGTNHLHAVSDTAGNNGRIDNVAPPWLKKWLHTDSREDKLIRANDRGTPFAKLADQIESWD